MKSIFFVEVTDTYGGESNYSWVHRFKVHASSIRGAIGKVAREMGLNFRIDCDYGDMVRYQAKSACICAFVSGYDDQAENFFNVKSL
jgi:hypothetical protein